MRVPMASINIPSCILDELSASLCPKAKFIFEHWAFKEIADENVIRGSFIPKPELVALQM